MHNTGFHKPDIFKEYGYNFPPNYIYMIKLSLTHWYAILTQETPTFIQL